MTIPNKIGHFQVKDKLGYGGMGTVYLAHDPRLNRDVAIKVMHEHLGHQDQFRERFAREAQAIAALDHPHIVRIFYADADQGRPYLVMEYFQDGSLRDHLNTIFEQEKLLSVFEVVNLVMQVAAALDYAHRKNMVHRDVKPDNVLLKSSLDLDAPGQFTAVLSDFGLVKIVQGTDMQSQAIPQGTYPYMAPEQFTGREQDSRTDLYSLGMMFYELLTGHLPFRSKSIMEIARMHIEHEPPAVSDLRANIPSELESVVMKCIAKRAERRFQTGKDLINALRQLQSDTKFGTTLDDMDTVIDSAGRLSRLMTYLAPPTAIEPSPVPFNLGSGLSTNISIPTNHLDLQAGESDEMKVVVHNRTSANEMYRLIVSDIAQEWVTINDPQLHLTAGESGEFTILVHPPRRSWSRAGHHRINFHVYNHREELIAEASGMVTIAAFLDLQARLDPEVIRPSPDQDKGDVQVLLHNRGNTVQDVTLSAHDNDAMLTFTPSTTKVTIEPGGQAKVAIRVTMREVEAIGKNRLPYTVMIRPIEGEILTLSGQMMNAKSLPPRDAKILTGAEARRLLVLTELTWGFLAFLVFGWLFMILDWAMTSEQLLDSPNYFHLKWALMMPTNNIVTLVMLMLAIGGASAIVGYLKQRFNTMQDKRITFWVDTGFAALMAVAFIGIFFLAIEIFTSGLNWADEGGSGVTPAAIVVSATLTLSLMIAAKNVMVNRVLR